MKFPTKTKIAACLFGAGILHAGQVLAAPPIEVQAVGFSGDQWVKPGASIGIRVNRMPEPTEGRFAVLVGQRDLTDLFAYRRPGELEYQGEAMRLPAGSADVVVYLVGHDDQWQELGRLPLKVLTAEGLKKAEVESRLDGTIKSQAAERHRGDAPPPERETFVDGAVQGGWTSEHQAGDWKVTSTGNIVGSTYRPEALRYGTEGNDAPRIDLSDYQVGLSRGDTQLWVGHAAYGNNPLLLGNGVRRGIVLSSRLGERVDVALNSTSALEIAGYNNLLGHSDRSRNNILAATVGLDVVKSTTDSANLRVELSYAEATRPSELNFDVGEVADEEESKGFGVRVTGTDPSGRLRGDLLSARATYRNPNDPLLAQGSNIVQVRRETNGAHSAEVSYDLLQNKAFAGAQSTTLTAVLRAAYADALYNAIGTTAAPDQMQYQFGLNGQFDQVAVSLNHFESEDNVDDLPTILKTRTESTDLTVALPMRAIKGGAEAGTLWPDITYGLNRTYQFGKNKPPEFDDPDSQIPNQVNLVNRLDFAWTWSAWDLMYSFQHSNQDNRQPGRAKADSTLLGNQLTLGLRPLERVTLSFVLGRVTQDQKEQDIQTDTDNVGVSVSWGFGRGWSLATSANLAKERNSNDTKERDSLSTAIQLNKTLRLPIGGGRTRPAQVFLRHAMENVDTVDLDAGVNTSARRWTINAGFSMSFF